jgi:ABC-2 type transport system ATP-binding protein
LLVLDEPTAAVDPAGSRQICELILELKATGITVLLSSHLLAQAEEICDRVGILSNGVLVREGALQELISRPNQTELVIENASPALIEDIKQMTAQRGARFALQRKASTTLEQVFLEATKSRPTSE